MHSYIWPQKPTNMCFANRYYSVPGGTFYESFSVQAYESIVKRLRITTNTPPHTLFLSPHMQVCAIEFENSPL